MKIMVIGGGGREHAIIKALKKSKNCEMIWALPGNGGIAADAQCVNIAATDIPAIVEFAKSNPVDFAVVAPDDPLVLGCVDELQKLGIPCFGPNKNAAIIEGSKVFSKNMMKEFGIPTAEYEVFDDMAKALEYIKTAPIPTVIKADGLALGKGVIIAQNFEEAEEAVKSIMEDKIFGASGSKIVVEEFLTGPEVSVLCFTDGKTLKPMISSMDHKRALDGDQGLNTGGMGTVAPNPYYTDKVAEECMKTIFRPTIEAMNNEGRTFKGCLYFGLMITPKGPKVIEYNCRFGDPETQVVLPLLDTDIIDIMMAIYDDKLDTVNVRWKNESAACVVMASGGYPKKYETGKEINGLDAKGQVSGAFVYHAGTKYNDGKFLTAGGRVLNVTATGKTLKEALDQSYSCVKKISFENHHFRTDIGARALAAEDQ